MTYYATTEKIRTGKTRLRALIDGVDVLLVLQVETRSRVGPSIPSWRDARIEDLAGAEIEVRV